MPFINATSLPDYPQSGFIILQFLQMGLENSNVESKSNQRKEEVDVNLPTCQGHDKDKNCVCYEDEKDWTSSANPVPFIGMPEGFDLSLRGWTYYKAMTRPQEFLSNQKEESSPCKACIKKIEFVIDREDSKEAVIEFPTPVPLCQALATVECWMSQPVTSEYFEMLRDDEDDPYEDYSYDEFSEEFETRGDVLGGLRFLEMLNFHGGSLKIECGS